MKVFAALSTIVFALLVALVTSTSQTSASRFLLSFTIICTHSLNGSLFNGLTGWAVYILDIRDAFTCSSNYDDTTKEIAVVYYEWSTY